MTAPERKIKETEALLSRVGSPDRTQDMLKQILENQLLLLKATNVHLSWGDE